MPKTTNYCKICGQGYSGFFSWFRALLCERQGPPTPKKLPAGAVFYNHDKQQDGHPILYLSLGADGITHIGHKRIIAVRELKHTGGQYWGQWNQGVFKRGELTPDGNHLLIREQTKTPDGKTATTTKTVEIISLLYLTKLKSDPSLDRLLGD